MNLVTDHEQAYARPLAIFGSASIAEIVNTLTDVSGGCEQQL
jgi:hypothetical protein